MTLIELLDEKIITGLSQIEVAERLAVCRHLPEFAFFLEKYTHCLSNEHLQMLYLEPTVLFYQVRNYAVYLIFGEKDQRDRYRICLDYVSAQRQEEVLSIEELQLLRLTLSFILRHHEHPYVVWVTACDFFLHQPHDEANQDYHAMLVNGTPEQATDQQRDALLAWGEVDFDALLGIVSILRKHHLMLGKQRLEKIKAFILNECSEFEKS